MTNKQNVIRPETLAEELERAIALRLDADIVAIARKAVAALRSPIMSAPILDVITSETVAELYAAMVKALDGHTKYSRDCHMSGQFLTSKVWPLVEAAIRLPTQNVIAPDTVAILKVRLLAIRDALVNKNLDDAYHELRMAVDPDCYYAFNNEGDHWVGLQPDAALRLPTQSKHEATLQNDLRELLLILGLGDHARPQSPHDVFQQCLIELRRRLQPAQGGQPPRKTVVCPSCDGLGAIPGTGFGAICSRCDGEGELPILEWSANAVANELQERLTLKYMGDCKCGQCALVPDELIRRAIAAIRSPAIHEPGAEAVALAALYEWYDRDGSVGGASQVFEQYRSALRSPAIHAPAQGG